MSYKIGDQIRISVRIIRLGVKSDPTSILLRIKNPSNIQTIYAPLKSSIGEYYYDLSLLESGNWYYKWEASGDASGVDEGSIYVEKSKF